MIRRIAAFYTFVAAVVAAQKVSLLPDAQHATTFEHAHAPVIDKCHYPP